jgi:hypothetical protein
MTYRAVDELLRTIQCLLIIWRPLRSLPSSEAVWRIIMRRRRDRLSLVPCPLDSPLLSRALLLLGQPIAPGVGHLAGLALATGARAVAQAADESCGMK